MDLNVIMHEKNNRINVPQSFPIAFKQIYSNIERCYLIILDNIIIFT